MKIDSLPVERVPSTKFLGVILQENLSWKNHISTLANKITKSIGVLRALQRKLPINILYMLYNTLIYPYLQYCNIAWGALSSVFTENLFILQKKALRIVSKVPWNSHTSPIFSSLKTLKLVDINKLQTGCFMYNAMANNLPPQFNNYFVKNTQIHTHFTRQSQQIHIYCPRTKVRKHSIKHFGSILWNSLPLVLKTKPSINTFKSAYKNNLLFQYTALSS